MRYFVIGDSVTWGQGLLDEQKIHIVVANRLAATTGDQPNIFHYAASGTTIGFKGEAPTSGVKIDSWWPRELPESNPTLYEQCLQLEADHPNQLFDYIILGGGINDVNVGTIYNPFTTVDHIQALCELYCHGAMSDLLTHIADTYVAANREIKVFLLGYYAVFSAKTEWPDVVKLVELLIHDTFDPGGLRTPTGEEFDDPISEIKGRLIRNGQAFRDAANPALAAAVADANSKGGAPNFVFIDPAIRDDEAAFAPNALIFGLYCKGNPEDPRAAGRKVYCEEVGYRGFDRFVCERASVGHPNIGGAKQYADKIFAAIES